MKNSPLVEYTELTKNHSGARKHKVDRISPHCVVGQCTIESLGYWFSHGTTQASSNYGIDKDGRIGMFVEEDNRSWCTSSAANDNRAITIECASEKVSPLYKMNDCVYESLVKLCVDICQRYGKKKLLWFDNKDYALSYEPKEDEMLITIHRWYAPKECPGKWLESRLGDLADRVTRILNGEEEEEDMTQDKFNEMMDNWLKEQAKKQPSSWSEKDRKWAESNGFIAGDENGNKMYKKLLTREEFIAVLHRAFKARGIE